MPAAVLLVDDERFARTVYSDYLRAAGYEVTVADSADAALTELGRRRYDLLITDVILPGADGLELLDEAKRLDPNIEAIVLTALDRVDPAVRAIKSGASDYLVKPVTPEALQIAVQRCLSARALLAENKALRAHLRLFEVCQRVTASLDHGRAVSLALGALASELEARGAVFVERGERTGSPAGAVGLAEGAAAELAGAARAAMPRLAGEALALATPLGRALLLPVADAESTFGAVCALRESASVEALSAAALLCSHLALALRTLGHLKQVEHLAYLDDLTHLYNTRFLDLVLDREVQASRAFAVLFLDLDRFKAVNDQFGHLVGSKLLVEVGRVLKSSVRDEDVVVRYGGDEYVAVLMGVDSGGALKVAERIRRSIEDHVFLSREGARVRVTASIGLASFPEHARSKAEVLDLADRAMYRGKRSTRNVVYIATNDLPPVPAREG
ncbi:GGDEF domain-containing response regulator [Anaeromyxobacter diazotrophicus]|uniref:diguanylate cyclase n=1 Tax=Anaeromyxobacter diazotrophicus TaxID=2590199 RepID=A0A7I9VJ94_9BACT|nr:diguanylate cyclase [Anaeromyxobacter diazotrophicus]GEJ56435.1 diguanylate cyclase response regulator [Anaeromyxobacter diazotrophicus]